MSAYSDRVIADGASYYWRLGEPSGTMAVATVGGANGTISGGVTLGVPGAIADGNTAMTFDGATGKVQTGSAGTVPVTCTCEGWIKTSVGGKPWLTLQTSGFTQYCGLEAGGTSLYFDQNIGAASGVRLIIDGQWHHLATVLTATTAVFYVDGVLDATVAFTRSAGNTTPIAIGWEIFNKWWSGSLDEVAIYPRALTAPEIAAHYQAARASQPFGSTWWQIQGDKALDSFNVWEAITPSNTVDLPRGVAGGIWVGTGGDIAAVMQNGTAQVLAAVPTGAWLPIAAKRINSTGTTASGLIALYEI